MSFLTYTVEKLLKKEIYIKVMVLRIAIPSKEYFAIRCGIKHKEVGEALYDLVVGICEIAEVEADNMKRIDYQMFWYRESSNSSADIDDSKYFNVDEKAIELIYDTIKRLLIPSILSYGEHKKAQGQDLLLQLNNGGITLKDFNENLKQDGE